MTGREVRLRVMDATRRRGDVGRPLKQKQLVMQCIESPDLVTGSSWFFLVQQLLLSRPASTRGAQAYLHWPLLRVQ